MEEDAIVTRTHSGMQTKLIKTQLTDGTIIYVQATATGGEKDVVSAPATFKQVTQAIEDIAQSLTQVWNKVGPSSASVELGVDFAYDSGEVLAMFLSSSASASMKITLNWGEPPKAS
ncbi:MAG: hypothetical protein H0U76_15650 [Ktedonobacteraceae bacterium]|nr:hypothetical protein [Ktedonobacteraceae bacterium]